MTTPTLRQQLGSTSFRMGFPNFTLHARYWAYIVTAILVGFFVFSCYSLHDGGQLLVFKSHDRLFPQFSRSSFTQQKGLRDRDSDESVDVSVAGRTNPMITVRPDEFPGRQSRSLSYTFFEPRLTASYTTLPEKRTGTSKDFPADEVNFGSSQNLHKGLSNVYSFGLEEHESQIKHSPNSFPLGSRASSTQVTALGTSSTRRLNSTVHENAASPPVPTDPSEDVDSPYDGCSAVRLAPPSKQCQLAGTRCKTVSGDALVDYMVVHYCTFGGNAFISVPLFSLGLLLAFYLLADTAESFFCPTVTTLSEMLDLAPNTAGVTLLALGNGAPDLLGSIASFSKGDPHMVVGAILSAGTFVTSFVVGTVAIFVGPFAVEGPAFIRNAAMYAMGVLLVLVLYSNRVLYFWQAAGLVLYYILFVAMVVFFDRWEHLKKQLCGSDGSSDSNSRSTPHRQASGGQAHAAGLGPSTPRHTASPKLLAGKTSPVTQIIIPDDDALASGQQPLPFRSQEQQQRQQQQAQPSLLEDLLSPWDRSASGSFSSHPIFTRSDSILAAGTNVRRSIDWTAAGLAAIKCAIHWVFDPIRWATVPTGQHPLRHDFWYRVANVIFCPAVFLWGLDNTFRLGLDSPCPWVPQLPLWVPPYFFLLLMGSISWAQDHSRVPPIWVVLTSFAMSITWVGVFARELLGLLSSIGAVLGASDAILGVTILAWGNSVGDLVTNVTMAMSGQPMMAVAGCFAGPLFNLMLGLGIPLAVKTASLAPLPWKFQDDPQISGIFPFLLLSVVGSLLVIPCSGFKVTRKWGCFLICLYITFIALSVFMEIVFGS